MDFLPKELEDIIMDYKKDLDDFTVMIKDEAMFGTAIENYIGITILEHIRNKVEGYEPEDLITEMYDFVRTIINYLNDLRRDGKIEFNYYNNSIIEYSEGSNDFQICFMMNTDTFILNDITTNKIQTDFYDKCYSNDKFINSTCLQVCFSPGNDDMCDLFAHISFKFKRVEHNEDEDEGLYELMRLHQERIENEPEEVDELCFYY